MCRGFSKASGIMDPRSNMGPLCRMPWRIPCTLRGLHTHRDSELYYIVFYRPGYRESMLVSRAYARVRACHAAYARVRACHAAYARVPRVSRGVRSCPRVSLAYARGGACPARICSCPARMLVSVSTAGGTDVRMLSART